MKKNIIFKYNEVEMSSFYNEEQKMINFEICNYDKNYIIHYQFGNLYSLSFYIFKDYHKLIELFTDKNYIDIYESLLQFMEEANIKSIKYEANKNRRHK